MRQLMAEYAATGLPPAFIPKRTPDDADPDPDPNCDPPEDS